MEFLRRLALVEMEPVLLLPLAAQPQAPDAKAGVVSPPGARGPAPELGGARREAVGLQGAGGTGKPEALAWGVGQEAEVFWEGPYPLREQPQKAMLTTDR